MWTELLAFVGVPVIRNVAGWIENSFKDKKIQSYEWTELFNTIFRVGVIGFTGYLGLNAVGLEIPAIGAGGLAVVFDFFLNSLRKRQTVEA